MDGVRLRIHPLMVPVGQTAFPAPYVDFLGALARLPWSRIPSSPVHAEVLLAAERLRLLEPRRLGLGEARSIGGNLKQIANDGDRGPNHPKPPPGSRLTRPLLPRGRVR